jgi:serine kinase of HPr protein (carbohydrate metabolism regulator)
LTISPTIHATAVLVGPTALLIRGAPGSGKSRLALRLIQCGALPFVRLVGDDRVYIEAAAGRLLVRPAGELAGLIEVRGLGIRRLPYERLAIVDTVVDLVGETERLPDPVARKTVIAGITLRQFGIALDADPLPVVLATLGTAASGN